MKIRDVYLPTRLPAEHSDKEIVICICLGGGIREEVSQQLQSYKRQFACSYSVTFQEWNVDKLADLIQANFLREELLPAASRSQLRKALALLDEPEASYRHFSDLIRSLGVVADKKDKERLTALRQMNICLWILYAWARDMNNVESAYLSGELTVLHGWHLTKMYLDESNNTADSIKETFQSLLFTYLEICDHFLEKAVLPFVDKRHALSVAVGGSCELDINLRMFDVLGRLALGGLWMYYRLLLENEATIREKIPEELKNCAAAVKHLIINNPTLLLPIKDKQVIDISIAVLLLMIEGQNENDIRWWLNELMGRAIFCHRTNHKYPCTIESYTDLLNHPQRDDNYLKEKTCGSVLYPMVALWASFYGDEQLFEQVKKLKSDHLQHCTFQLWFPGETSEQNIYTNTERHGTAVVVEVDQTLQSFAAQLLGECEHSPQLKELSAVTRDFWPLIFMACRHYRLPIPIHFFKDLMSDAGDTQTQVTEEPVPTASDK